MFSRHNLAVRVARMGSCKSQRSSMVFDRATSSPSIEDRLPQEMLEAVLGKLDQKTLRTARLVSRTFCAAASANVSSLTFRCPSQPMSFERFPRLEEVRVHDYSGPSLPPGYVRERSLAEIDPRLCAVITHLTLSPISERCTRMEVPELPGMPKLRELDVGDVNPQEDFGVTVDEAEVLHRLTNLEVLRIGPCTPSVAMTITTMTCLTSLVIGVVVQPGDWWQSGDISWLHHATNLRELQALRIRVSHEALPLIGKLMTLTGLTWLGDMDGSFDMADNYSIAPLSHLSRLRSLSIHPEMSERDVAIACSLGSGCLAKLHVYVAEGASADCGRLLARQTALTELSVGGEQLCNLRHMGALRMELLRSLQVFGLDTVDAEGLDVLQRATSLAKLRISFSIDSSSAHPDVQLSRTIGRLTRLRSMQLEFPAHKVRTTNLNLRLAFGPLTALTRLEISAARLDSRDLRALLGLTGLQVLRSYGCRLTDDVVPELAVLTDLRALKLRQL